MAIIIGPESRSDHPPPGYPEGMGIQDTDVSLAEFEVLERASTEEVSLELINGRIYVVPVPDGEHDEFAATIRNQVLSGSEAEFFHGRGLRIPAYREGRSRVDGAVARRGYFRGEPSWADPSGVQMIVEITSGRDRDAEVDRVEKRDAYAQAAIPVYLLVDRHRGEVTVFWEPSNGAYAQLATAKFGARLALPDPFGFELDTAEFL
ncbi:Uma2 family endonuclease [Nocardia puris]|uniref:Uma2 family endonuclease n=1 Tax=Nocardia puris TaxID=208602 RepID=UPI001E400F7B|nr:Uma2 family endonuclease [Nocardia puris]